MKKCTLCGKELGNIKADFCKTCFLFLRSKHKQENKLKEVIKCHKEYAKIKQG